MFETLYFDTKLYRPNIVNQFPKDFVEKGSYLPGYYAYGYSETEIGDSDIYQVIDAIPTFYIGYKFTDEPGYYLHHGFLAEKLAKILPDHVVKDVFTGETLLKGVKLNEIVVMQKKEEFNVDFKGELDFVEELDGTKYQHINVNDDDSWYVATRNCSIEHYTLDEVLEIYKSANDNDNPDDMTGFVKAAKMTVTMLMSELVGPATLYKK